jgi:hypothetical protein
MVDGRSMYVKKGCYSKKQSHLIQRGFHSISKMNQRVWKNVLHQAKKRISKQGCIVSGITIAVKREEDLVF